LKQISGIEFPLLVAYLFLLIDTALAAAKGFEDFAFAIGLMIIAERFLAYEFELEYVGLEFLAEDMQVLAEDGGELEFSGAASSLERDGIGPRGLGQGAFQLREFFLGTRDLEIRLLQFEGTLAFDALTQAEQGSECEAESHDSGGHIQKNHIQNVLFDDHGFRSEAP